MTVEDAQVVEGLVHLARDALETCLLHQQSHPRRGREPQYSATTVASVAASTRFGRIGTSWPARAGIVTVSPARLCTTRFPESATQMRRGRRGRSSVSLGVTSSKSSVGARSPPICPAKSSFAIFSPSALGPAHHNGAALEGLRGLVDHPGRGQSPVGEATQPVQRLCFAVKH